MIQAVNSISSMYQSISDEWGPRVRDRYLAYQRDPDKFLAENPLRTNSNKKPITCYEDVRQAAIALHGTNPTRMAICLHAGASRCYFTKMSPAQKIEIAELAGIALTEREKNPDGFTPYRKQQAQRRKLMVKTAEEWGKAGKPLKLTVLAKQCGAHKTFFCGTDRQLMRHQVRKAHEKGLEQFQTKEAS